MYYLNSFQTSVFLQTANLTLLFSQIQCFRPYHYCFASTLAIWPEFFPIISLFCTFGDLNLILSKVPKIRLYFHYLFASTLRDLILILSKNLPLCTLGDLTSILSKVSRFTPYFHYLFTNTLKHISLTSSENCPNFASFLIHVGG